MFLIYGREDCGWCKKALNFIRNNFPNEEIEYVDYEKFESAKSYLKQQGHTTVPQIYHLWAQDERTYIGGYEALVKYTANWYSGQPG